MAPRMAVALREQEMYELVTRALEFYPDAIEALDRAPRPAHVSAMVEEIRRETEGLLALFGPDDGLSGLTIHEWLQENPRPEDDVEAILQALTASMFPLRNRRGWIGVRAVGRLLSALDDADTTTLDQLSRALRSATMRLPGPGEPLKALLLLLLNACTTVSQGQSDRQSRGRPPKDARRFVICELDGLFRRFAWPAYRGRLLFITVALEAAQIPHPEDPDKLRRLLPAWGAAQGK